MLNHVQVHLCRSPAPSKKREAHGAVPGDNVYREDIYNLPSMPDGWVEILKGR